MLDIITNLLGVVSTAASRQVTATAVTCALVTVISLIAAVVLFRWSYREKQEQDTAGRASYEDGPDTWMILAFDTWMILAFFGIVAFFIALISALAFIDYAIAFDYKVLIAMRNLLR